MMVYKPFFHDYSAILDSFVHAYSAIEYSFMPVAFFLEKRCILQYYRWLRKQAMFVLVETNVLLKVVTIFGCDKILYLQLFQYTMFFDTPHLRISYDSVSKFGFLA